MAGQALTIDALIAEVEKFIEDAVRENPPAQFRKPGWQRLVAVIPRAFTKCLHMNYQGGYLYVPIVKDRLKTALLADFNGENHRELALKYGYSLANVYRILRNSQAAVIAERPKAQPVLLDVLENLLPKEFERVGLQPEESRELAHKIAARICVSYAGMQFRCKKIKTSWS